MQLSRSDVFRNVCLLTVERFYCAHVFIRKIFPIQKSRVRLIRRDVIKLLANICHMDFCHADCYAHMNDIVMGNT